MKTSDPTIRISYTYEVAPAIVWNAIANHADMIQWYFPNIPEFEAVEGFKTAFLIENEGRKFTHTWEVIDVVPGQRLDYTWMFPEYAGLSKSLFLLEPSGEGTKLTIEVDVLEDFPDGIPEFNRESCEGGWHYFLGERLMSFLSNK